MVSTGSMALRSAWRHNTARRGSPLARAVRMKSSPSTSSSAERVTRARIAACGTASATDGRISDFSAGQAPALQPGKPPAGTSRSHTAKT